MAGRIGAHQAGTTRMLLSPDGTRLLSGGADCVAKVFQFDKFINGQAKLEVRDQKEPITCLAFSPASPSGDIFATGGEDGHVWLYELEGTEVKSRRQVFFQCAAVIRGLAFSPDGRKLAVASDNGLRVVALEVVEGESQAVEVVPPLADGKEIVLAVTWLSDGHLATAVGSTGELLLWNVAGDRPQPLPKLGKEARLSSTRQRNEEIALHLPATKIIGMPGFAAPKDEQVLFLPIGGRPAPIVVPDLRKPHEVMLVVAHNNGRLVAALDDIGYLTFIDTSTLKVMARHRPVLGGTDGELVCDMAFHPTVPGAVLVATTRGKVQLLAGLYDEPKKRPKKPAALDDDDDDDTVRRKRKKKKSKELDEDEERRKRWLVDEASEASDEDEEEEERDREGEDGEDEVASTATEDLDESDMPAHEADDDSSYVEDDEVREVPAKEVLPPPEEYGEAIPMSSSLRPLHPPFQPGSTPAYQGDDEGECRMLCWNSIGWARLFAPPDGSSTITVSFYDRSKYSTFRMTQRPNDDGPPLSIAAIGRTGMVFASTDSMSKANKLVYRSLVSWGTNPDWMHSLPENETPRCVAIGDMWVACFTSLHLRLFTHTGVETAVVSLPHRVVCATGLDAYQPPNAGEVPLRYNPVDALAFAYDTGLSLCTQVWGVASRKVIEGEMPLALTSPDSRLKWIGFSDEGLLATQDSEGVVRVLTHSWGRQWMPVFEPRREAHPSLHMLAIRGHQLVAVGVEQGLSFPDPRKDDHTQIRVPLALPVLSDRPSAWAENSALAMFKQLLAEEKKERATHYTPDIAKLEVASDQAILSLFSFSLESSDYISTARALDLAKMLAMREHLEQAMQIAYQKNEDALYRKMRQVFDLDFSQGRMRRCRLPEKGKQTKEEQLVGWVKQYRQKEQQWEKEKASLQSSLLRASQAAQPPADSKASSTEGDTQRASGLNSPPSSTFTLPNRGVPDQPPAASKPAPSAVPDTTHEAATPPRPTKSFGKFASFSPNEDQGTDPHDIAETLSLMEKKEAPQQQRKKEPAEQQPNGNGKRAREAELPEKRKRTKDDKKRRKEKEEKKGERKKKKKEGKEGEGSAVVVEVVDDPPESHVEEEVSPSPPSPVKQLFASSPTKQTPALAEGQQAPAPPPQPVKPLSMSSNDGAAKLKAMMLRPKAPPPPPQPKFLGGALKDVTPAERTKTDLECQVTEGLQRAREAAKRVGGAEDSDSDDNGPMVVIGKS